jgi:hypothetical protein
LNEETSALRKQQPESFYSALKKALAGRKIDFDKLCPTDDPVARRALEDYGAMFVAAETIVVPSSCVFADERETEDFQTKAGIEAADFDGVTIELQPEAMGALLKARTEAQVNDLNITPRDGREAGRRTFGDSLRLWDTRFLPALDYWTKQGRISPEKAGQLRRLTPREQVRAVLELEAENIFFSKDFSKSVFYSIAPPGASQHLAMLAFDVVEFADERVRSILARHGWFQTVLSDLPHFTFLGLDECDLPARGLRREQWNEQIFWIPNV